MKRVRVVYRDFSKVSKVQPDWAGTQGRADQEARTIYIDQGCPDRTTWSKRVILEHERAHFVLFDAGLEVDARQEELFADWLGLIRTPNKYLHINERYMKDWLLRGREFRTPIGKHAVLVNLVVTLDIKHEAGPEVAARCLLDAL